MAQMFSRFNKRHFEGVLPKPKCFIINPLVHEGEEIDGLTEWSPLRISLSGWLAVLPVTFRFTLLHEMVHVFIGPEDVGHENPRFARKMLSILKEESWLL